MTVGLLRCLTFGVLLVGLGLAAAVEAAETNRGLTVPLRASEAKDASVAEEVVLYGASYALVIGIDKYTAGWPRLSKAVEDARLVAKELERKGFSVTLKTDLKSRELEDVLKEFFAIKGTDPEARLFLWYAGHGHTEGGEGFLVPADAPRPENAGLFRLKALALRRIGEYVRLARSKHAFAIFDSCFSGTVFQSARALPPAAVTRATTLPVRQFLTSGDAGQTVSDDGAFRELFLRALRGEERADANGDGYVTASEIGLFLTDRVTNLTQSKQTPRYGKLRDKDWDRGDFVFALSKVAAAAAGTAPPRRAPPVGGATPEMMFWQSIQNSTNPDSFKAYLSQFPDGTFAALAKVKLKELQGRKTAALTPPKSDKPRGWLGVQIQAVTGKIAETLGLDKPRGALVITAIEGGPAEAAGVKAGDVILQFNGIDVAELRQVSRLVASTPVGERVTVDVWRDGRVVPLWVTLGELTEKRVVAATPPAAAPATQARTLKELGLVLAAHPKGVEITRVDPKSRAHERGLRAGNIIESVNRKPVSTPARVAQLIDETRRAGRKKVLFLVAKQDDKWFIALTIAEPK